MKKRLMTGMLVGGLMAAMVPGVASAAEPKVNGSQSCTTIDGTVVFTIFFTDRPISEMGAAISGSQHPSLFCSETTVTFTLENGQTVVIP